MMMMIDQEKGQRWWLWFREENEQDEVSVGMTDREGRDGEGFGFDAWDQLG